MTERDVLDVPSLQAWEDWLDASEIDAARSDARRPSQRSRYPRYRIPPS
jgi:hypothetical protein